MWKQRLAAYVFPFQHPAWGLAHVRRVLEMALWIAHEEGMSVDQDAMIAAAYLHDMGSFKPFRIKGRHHGDCSAEVVQSLLQKVGFPEAKTALVRTIIEGHMYYAEPASIDEARVFHDADVLDGMGTIGITRWLSIVGLDDLAPDVPSAIHLIERFRTELPDKLCTATAKTIGQKRADEMTLFLDSLSESSEHFRLL